MLAADREYCPPKYREETTGTQINLCLQIRIVKVSKYYYIYCIPTNVPSLKHKSGLGNKPVALTVEAPAHFPEETFDFFKRHTATPFLSLNTSLLLPNYHTSSR